MVTLRSRTSSSVSPDIDAGWAWVIAAAALLAASISSGKFTSFFIVNIAYLSIYLYNKEKTCFFVRLSVCLSTFLILIYFSKSIIVTQKIIIELRVKNSKEGNWKGKMWIR